MAFDIAPPKTKVCSDCEKEKPYTDEYFPSFKVYRKVYLFDRCIECQEAWKAWWVRERAAEKLHTFLKRVDAQQRRLIREVIKNHPNFEPIDGTREGAIARGQNIRARQMRVIGRITGDDVRLQKKSQNGLCWWCDQPHGDDWQLDHRIPLTRQGTNTVGNICCTCRSCNARKSNKLPYEWNGRLL